MKHRRASDDRESGYALLLVFAMAAIVSIMLYLELPRVAFEAQRVREQLLIDRGEQYARAIKLYMRKFPGKYPASIDQLEDTNNIRFLRRRYKDPMTGSDEWRIIHAGPGGVLTDSLVQKPPQTKQEGQFGSSIGTPIGSNSDTSSSDSSNQSALPAGPPRRQSEGGNLPGFPGNMISSGMQSGQMYPGDQMQQGQPAYPNVVPGQPLQFQPGQPGQQPYMPGQPGQVQPGQTVPFGQVGAPGQPYPSAQPGAQPGQPSYGQVPGQPGFGPGIPGLPSVSGSMNPSTPGYGQSPSSATPGYGQGQPSLYGPPVPSGGLNNQQPPGAGSGTTTPTVPGMIDRALRSGSSGFGFSTPGGQTIGGGIAGVATKFEAHGIKVYNERTKYNEWEFVYDPRKDLTNPMMVGPQLGPQTQPGSGFQPAGPSSPASPK